jgi:hypothetical protein
MGDGEGTVRDARRLLNAGFGVGIYAVLYPSPEQLSAISQMQFRCRDAGIDFRVKEYLGRYDGRLYGDYMRYSLAVDQGQTRSCLCRISELLIGTNAAVYRCHRDLYGAENPLGNLLDPGFHIEDEYRLCHEYGHCHPCDVKTKTDHKQRLGYTSVEIGDVH